MASNDPTRPAGRSFAITPNDGADLPSPARSIWVGGAGDIKLTLVDDDANHAGVVFKAIPVGTLLPFAVRRVYATGTTATLLSGIA